MECLEDPSQDAASPPVILAQHHHHHQQQQQLQQQGMLISGPPSNPLLLPEILQHLEHYLHPRSIPSCVQVCHLWHQAFVFFLWQNVKITHHIEDRRRPNLEDLRKYAHLTKTLSLTLLDPIPPDFSCPNLTVLDLGYGISSSGDSQRRDELDVSLSKFLRQHAPKLTHFDYHSETSPAVLDMIESLQMNIPSLSFRKLCCESPDWLRIQDALLCKGRTTLSLRGPTGKEGKPFLPNNYQGQPESSFRELKEGLHLMRPCTQLQDLRLETDMDNRVMVDCHYGLIRKCPNLVRLYWTAEDWSPNPFSGVRMNKMAKEVEDQGSCPWKRLESLSLPGMDFKLSDFDVLINALSPTLRDLDLSWTNFDDLAWDIMYKATPSWTNLRTLNLRNCDILYGWYIHQMLCTLSGLEIFAANEFSDHDILDDDQPWICTRIRELSVGCLLFDDDTEPMMLQRFSGFTQLEVLNLSFSSTIVMDKIPGNERHLALMLDQGLDSLKTLKQLRVLELPGRDATDWSVQEAAWIKKHWPRLEKIIGKRPLYAEAYALLEYIWAVPTPSS